MMLLNISLSTVQHNNIIIKRQRTQGKHVEYSQQLLHRSLMLPIYTNMGGKKTRIIHASS